MIFFSGDCRAFLLRYLEVMGHRLDFNSYCQQDDVTQFQKVLVFKLFGHRSEILSKQLKKGGELGYQNFCKTNHTTI